MRTKAGYYGARMVLASGLNMKMRRDGVKEVTKKRAETLIYQVENGEMDSRTALYKAVSFPTYFNNIPSLQANFAFSRAYIAEGQGKQAGFEGNHLFIDTSIFSAVPDWLKYSKTIHWEYPGLGTEFIQYSSIDLETANKLSGEGVLDTEVIAQKITKEKTSKEELLSRLK